ncbi:ring-cleaving dioxygenase [bacterium]|nr:MAG: ring-cleaving dioxygenase [bacterium]
MGLLGLHHVSCLCDDPQTNLDFYVRTLGLRLVKRTVNFDDPGAYHLYYGDGRGTPGTLLTFFPIAGLAPGRMGPGAASRIDLAARPDSVEFWSRRLEGRLVEGALEFEDPDGLPLRIVPIDRPPLAAAWPGLKVPPEHALGAIDRIRLDTAAFDGTRETLELLGFVLQADDGETATFGVAGGGPVKTLEVRRTAGSRAIGGAGTIHHLALRVADDAAQAEWRTRLTAEGYGVSPVRDRDYFRSIYFREPGGTLLEIATDGPGFTADERPETLGESLRLPPFAEPHRKQIEATLPALNLPL